MTQLHAASFIQSFVGLLGAQVEADAEYRKVIGNSNSRHALPAGNDWTEDSAST